MTFRIRARSTGSGQVDDLRPLSPHPDRYTNGVMSSQVDAVPSPVDLDPAVTGESAGLRPAAAPPWPHATDSPTPFARADDTARIVRRASYAMAPCTVDDAVVEMTLLGYRFHLFNEIGSGTAAVVYRGGPTGLRLALVTPDVAGELAGFTQLVTISPHPLPCLREDAAIARLGLLKLPFMFYIDAAQGRASVLYRRVDGDLAIITPAG